MQWNSEQFDREYQRAAHPARRSVLGNCSVHTLLWALLLSLLALGAFGIGLLAGWL